MADYAQVTAADAIGLVERDEVWLLELDLTHADGTTTLTFCQPGVTREQVGGVGPGWDYYLDRLVDVETGADPSQRDFERDYYPATSDHYVTQFD